MRFDVRNFLKNGRTPYTAQFTADMKKMDFDGYSVADPVDICFEAFNVQDGIEMHLHIQAQVQSECARCLEPVTESYSFSREYLIRERDLEDSDCELPLDADGCMEIEVLAYQELIFEVPRVLLCTPDCKGLCPICGKKRAAGCTCQPAEDAAPPDARLSILKQLLS